MSTAIGNPSRQIIGEAEQLADGLNYIITSANYREYADKFKAFAQKLRKVADDADDKKHQEMKAQIDDLYTRIKAHGGVEP